MACCTAPAVAQRQVPSVKGSRVQIAKQYAHLADLQFAEGVFYIAPNHWRDDIRTGVVYVQTPQPGTTVPAGTTIGCWTFEKAKRDQKIVEMPEVRKLPREKALAEIEDVGLSPMRSPAAEKDDASGRIVIDQYPRGGQSVIAGTSVYLLLAHEKQSSVTAD